MNAFAGQEFAVMLGGTAAEREVSLQSGAAVAAALRRGGATVREVDPAVKGWQAELAGVDFVFNFLHGPGGEDGCLQGYCEMIGLPYSGSGVAGAALTMNKVTTKQLWLAAELPTAPFAMLSAESDWDALIAEHGCLFVKPAREGSSLGMSRASDAESLRRAWLEASRFGDAVMAERFVNGEEFTVAVLGDSALPSIRIESAAEFYDYNAKYLTESTQFHCPSGLSPEEEEALSRLAVAAFSCTGAQVWGRVDLIRDRQHGWQLLEVNTVPGMTSHSLVPMAAKALGMDMTELLHAIYRLSMEVRNDRA